MRQPVKAISPEEEVDAGYLKQPELSPLTKESHSAKKYRQTKPL